LSYFVHDVKMVSLWRFKDGSTFAVFLLALSLLNSWLAWHTCLFWSSYHFLWCFEGAMVYLLALCYTLITSSSSIEKSQELRSRLCAGHVTTQYFSCRYFLEITLSPNFSYHTSNTIYVVCGVVQSCMY